MKLQEDSPVECTLFLHTSHKVSSFLICVCISRLVMSDSLRPHALYHPPDSSVHGFSRQENWSGLPFPSPADLPDHGIKAGSPALQADSLPSEPPGKPQHPVHAKLPEVSLCDPVGCSLPGPTVHGGFSRQEYWSGLSFPSPGGLPYPGTEAGWVFCIGKQILYHLSHQGSPSSPVII